jgi:hypothetical protein
LKELKLCNNVVQVYTTLNKNLTHLTTTPLIGYFTHILPLKR